jgi:signal transduction histidine kinase
MQPSINGKQDFASQSPAQASRQQANKQEEQVPLWVLDLLLGVTVSLVIAIVITADQGGLQDPDAVAYLFACAFGASMVLRRRFPVAVLVVTTFLLSAYYILDYPAIGLAVPVAAALYSAAEFGHLTAAIIVSLLLVISSTFFRILDGEAIAYLLGYELIPTVTLMAAAIALGDSTRSRRTLRAEQEQTARLIEQEHAYRAEQQVQMERLRMARDLHDVIGHSISVISLHADVAREAIGHNDEAARQALRHIRAATSETMRELRATVKALRTPTSAAADRSVASLMNLSALVESATASGLSVDLQIEGEMSALPARVDTAAYRIVQESLTNVIRHADASRVTLMIAVDAQQLRLQFRDNGTTTLASVTPGSGIAGMSERARLLGGTLSVQPHPSGGLEVNATLPMKDAP